jgi:hypothetical protein
MEMNREPPTHPAKATTPSLGAAMPVPMGAAMSIPRWPEL